jgi:hypothetical protein
MTDNNYPFFPIFLGGLAFGFFAGGMLVTVTERRHTEKQTVVYCMEQPSACKIKYDYYKLEK